MSDPNSEWFLEGCFDSGDKTRVVGLGRLPGVVGRRPEQDVALPFMSVSVEHAELFVRDGRLWVRDLGSTNGTFVNRARIEGPTQVRHGDVLHFGREEFRLLHRITDFGGGETIPLDLDQENLPHVMATGLREMDELLRDEAVVPFFQPLVELSDDQRIGFEVLGRGAHPTLPVSPYELFRVAAAANKEVELSALFRDRGVQVGAGLEGQPQLYVNTHPAELRDQEGLVASLARLRESAPDVQVVLEIHEAAVLGPAPMRRLRERLVELGMGLAYDDFGAGHSRLAELLEVPPDVLKFDIAIVRDIHLAADSKRQMVGTLVRVLKEQGIKCLAEGVERKEEATACRELGFDLAQGWHFGKPAPAPAD